MFLYIAVDRDAPHIFHNDVGSIIFLKAVVNFYDAGNILEHSQNTGFPQKTAPSEQVVFFKLRKHGNFIGLTALPHRPLHRKKLLYCHGNPQLFIPCSVGETKPTRANDGTKLIAPMQQCVDFQCGGGIVGRLII